LADLQPVILSCEYRPPPDWSAARVKERRAEAGRAGAENRGQGREGQAQGPAPVRRDPPPRDLGRGPRAARLLLRDEEARVLGQKVIFKIRPCVPTSQPACGLANATAQ